VLTWRALSQSPRDSQDLTKASTGKLDGGAPPDPQRCVLSLSPLSKRELHRC